MTKMKKGTLPYLVEQFGQSPGDNDKLKAHLWYAIRGALDSKLLISNLAEVMRASASETEQLLVENGFGDLVAHYKESQAKKAEVATDSLEDYSIPSPGKSLEPFQDLLSVEFSPSLSQPIKVPAHLKEIISLKVKNITQSNRDDAFAALYRKDIKAYYDKFMATEAKKIDDFIAKNFSGGYPKYIVNAGIGGNEQFNHFVSRLYNRDSNRELTWFLIDSPRKLTELPLDATVENTIFLEFSRSGKTEETVKTHEYTPRDAKRIVFANSGPLKELAERDNNLLLEFPDQVAGRFGRNTTPFLLAPMYVAKMDTLHFWQTIEKAINAFDLTSADSLSVQIAQFIYANQQKNGINHIYFGCNDDLLICSADEILQFWNEGVNKGGNDLSMSRYFGLPRDSHLNIEGILANHKTKMGIFLLRDNMSPAKLPPLTSKELAPINPAHKGLCYGEEEVILAEANYQRFCDLMPAIKITVHNDITLEHAAILGQLWADVTFFYSRMVNVDPGSNPEVKYVRDRAEKLLAEEAKLKRGQ